MPSLQERLARGDPTAFGDFYDALADRLGHYLLVRIGAREDAEDALQETFLRLARNRRKLADVENLDAFAFTIARNEAARLAARRAKRRDREPAPPSGDDLFCAAPDDAEARESAEAVAAALAGLAPKLRELVELKIYAGLTFDEIARVTGLPQGTVATRYRSALAKMREKLSGCPKTTPLSRLRERGRG
jgi:RNA polymerase sigma-70 factor, ECF subfamily